jgi:lipoprotein-anchoring transpeptidase ErfK/SrfK
VRLPLFQRGHEQLAVGAPIAAVDPVPSFLDGGGSARMPSFGLLRRSIPHGSMLAFTRAFDVGGRTFLLSTDLTVVPADRVRRFRPSEFRGVVIDDALAQPIGFFRKKPRPQYRLSADRLEQTGASFAVRSHVRLDGHTREQDGKVFHRVAGAPGRYAAEDDLTLVRRRGKRPFGVTPGEKWMIVSITNGTLVAYDDDKPVFATLVSPGQGGLPRKGGDLVKDSTTPLGNYRITFKDKAATMSPEFGENRSFWIADVPFTQYFRPPFALHAAYWHESFGEYMSGGCINASPTDAKWLFDWSDPQVPDGWQGATGVGAKANGNATWIVVTR